MIYYLPFFLLIFHFLSNDDDDEEENLIRSSFVYLISHSLSLNI